MTKEEQAIEYIKKYRELDEKLYNTAPKGTVSSIAIKKCLEFWDMAIQALSQQPTFDDECQKDMNEMWEYNPCETCGYVEGSPFCLQYCPYDAEKKEPCDAISRADRLIDLANAIESDDSGYWTNRRISSALRNISSIVEKLPSKPIECDAIRREDAINIVSLHCLTIDETVKALEQLPSVNTQSSEHFIDGVHAMGYREGYKDAQKQKYGKWIDREIYDADRWKCSECGRTEQYRENYCPNCGCRMVEPRESEEV